MKTYGGFKVIEAEPMDSAAALEAGHKIGGSQPDGTPGYEVTYEDGYKSWSPADVFDKAYTPLAVGQDEFHPAIAHVMGFFTYAHLPERLQAISAPFTALAFRVARRAPNNQETTVALRKLLEAKDAAVRAGL